MQKWGQCGQPRRIESKCSSPGAICVRRGKPVSEGRVGLWADLGPLVMAALVVVNEPSVTRMVNYGIVQRRIPSFRPRRAAPSRLAEAHQMRKQRSDPLGPDTGSQQKVWAPRFFAEICRHVLIELLAAALKQTTQSASARVSRDSVTPPY